jgi:exodeoxyribonuclease VII large subunit
LNDRWGGVKVDVAHVQVQGADAPDQMIRAINYFNAQEVLPEVLVIIRGGGSADDLSAFNDELLVRAIASSRVPTLVGVGHEIDETLADLAADVRAATPSNAAQLLVPDRAEVKRSLMSFATRVSNRMERVVSEYALQTQRLVEQASEVARVRIDTLLQEVATKQRVLEAYDPRSVLERGYAIVRGVVRPGEMIVIERKKDSISAEVTHVTNKAN